MSDARKQILSLFTGCRKLKAWKTREKNMTVTRRENFAETGRGSYYKEEWLEKFLDSKSVFCNGNESDNDDDSYTKNDDQQQLPKGFDNSCHKIVSLILLQKLINDFPVCKHCSRTLLLVEDLSHGFGN